jgi:parvulin-like peptidyl-prolyl isomerase
LAKKQKKAAPKRAPTKHQLSKWQRQTKIRRIVIIAAVVFLAGILSWVGYESYKDYKSDPLREVVIEVNGVSFTMDYYVKMLDAYTAGANSTDIYYYGDYVAGMVADEIIKTELSGQGAKNLGIEVTTEEIEAELEEYNLPNDRVYRNIVRTGLLQKKLKEYFDSQLPDTMEQAHVQVMLVESQEVADEVITKIEIGGNFTALAEEFSCGSSIEGDLGWLPRELMPNTLIADAAFNLTPGEISPPIYDETATKNVGYWLIEVTERQDEEVEARAMLLGSEAEAERVKAELVSGNFSSLAMEYSQHESKTEGGELGWLKQGDMGSEAFDEVAFNIIANEVSGPVKDESVQTTGGYWIVNVVDRGDHELEEKVREELTDKHFNDWLEEWKENSTIENLLDEEKRAWAIDKVLEGR